MWKAAVALAGSLCLPVIGCCADFWQAKDPDAWNEKELAKIRSKSPWAQRQPQTEPRNVTRTATRRTTTPITSTTTLPSGKTQTQTTRTTQTTQTTQTRTVHATVADVQIRWESAAPLLAATARIDPAMRKVFDKFTGEYYLVSLTGLALPDGSDPSTAISDLLAGSSLHLGAKVVRPSRVSEMASGDGPLYLLQFSRDGALESYANRIEVQVYFGGTHVRAPFEPKQMVFQGRPAL